MSRPDYETIVYTLAVYHAPKKATQEQLDLLKSMYYNRPIVKVLKEYKELIS